MTSPDVICTVIKYLGPQQLPKFFVDNKLDFGFKFKYDGTHWEISVEESNYIFGMFPGMMCVGICLCVRDLCWPLMVPIDKMIRCTINYYVNNGYIRENFMNLVLGRFKHISDITIKNVTNFELEKLQNFSLRKLSIDGYYGRGLSLRNLRFYLRLKKFKLLLPGSGIMHNDFKILSDCRNLKHLELCGPLLDWGNVLMCENLRYFKYNESDSLRVCGNKNIILSRCQKIRIIILTL